MAKKLLLDALTGAIGDFVEGITEENLKLGIWSGKVRGWLSQVCEKGTLRDWPTAAHPSSIELGRWNSTMSPST